MMSRRFAGALLSLGLIATPAVAPAVAQEYPARSVRIIVPGAPGGGTDSVARVLAQQLSNRFGQQFWIENRPGAGSMAGLDAAARAAPDGYTLVMSPSSLATLHLAHASVPFHPLESFAPLSQVLTLPNVLVVPKSLPADNVAAFIALAKERPGELTYGSAGIGTAPHIAAELFKSMAKVDLRHIPYRGVAPAMTDLLAARLSAMIVNVLSAKAHIDSGALRALAVTTAQRTPIMTDLPTLSEAGIAGYEATQWFGMLAPAGTPEEVVARLNRAIVEALQTPEMKARLAAEGAEAIGNTPAEFTDLIKRDLSRWSQLARQAKFRTE